MHTLFSHARMRRSVWNMLAAALLLLSPQWCFAFPAIDPPTSFVGEADGTTASFSWINSTSPTYATTMLRRGTSDFPTSTSDGTLVASDMTGTAVSDTDLADGTYYYSLFALDEFSDASPPATTTVTIDTTPPTMPVIATPDSPSQVYSPTLMWTTSTDAGVGFTGPYYHIEWSQDPTFSLGTVGTYTGRTAYNLYYSHLPDGAWYFRVNASDAYGNQSAYSTTSAYIVDTTPPVITLRGNASVTLQRNDTYQELGATALDAIEGDITSDISREGTLHTDIPGTYVFTYNVRDSAGNIADGVTRTVTVRGGGGSVAPPSTSVQTRSDDHSPLRLTINERDQDLTTSSSIVTLGFNADPQTVKGMCFSLEPDCGHSVIVPYANSTSFQLPSHPGTYTISTKLFSVTGNPSQTFTHTIIYQPSSSVSSSATSTTEFSSAHFHFSRNLKQGAQGEDVRALQQELNQLGFMIASSGPGSPSHESDYFGPATAQAVKRFQEAHTDHILTPFGLRVGTGRFYDATRTYLQSLVSQP